MKNKKSFGIICLRFQSNLSPHYIQIIKQIIQSKLIKQQYIHTNNPNIYSDTHSNNFVIKQKKKYQHFQFLTPYSNKASTKFFDLLSQFQIQYLFVQRKNTYEYIQILCGKYDINNHENLQYLYDQLTYQECDNLLNLSFSECWKQLWQFNDHQMLQDKYYPDFLKAQKLFNQYQAKTYIYPPDRSFVRQDNSWSFPKGHRNKSDQNTFITALREFQEETQINIQNISILTKNNNFLILKHQNLQNINPSQFYKIPIEYQGSDSLFYQIDYYVALFNNFQNLDPRTSNLQQTHTVPRYSLASTPSFFPSASNFIQVSNDITLKEISQIQWVDSSKIFTVLQIQQKQHLYFQLLQLQNHILDIFKSQ